MWQVVTSPSSVELFAGAEDGLSEAELEALLNALSEFQPSPLLPVSPSPNLLPSRPGPSGWRPPQPEANRAQDALRTLDIQHSAQPLEMVTLPPETRSSLLDLRTKVMLAAEIEGLRTVLLCRADVQETSPPMAAQLSQLLAEYERLKVACLVVGGAASAPAARRNVSPIGYTFQLRRTRRPNLYEIASSLGAVYLEDWLRWWSPVVVMREMKKVIDLVVLQAPSINTYPDVALLAAAVDGVILVATEDVTSYAGLDAAQQRLRAANARILGVTTNQSPVAPRGRATARLRKLFTEWVKSK